MENNERLTFAPHSISEKPIPAESVAEEDSRRVNSEVILSESAARHKGVRVTRRQQQDEGKRINQAAAAPPEGGVNASNKIYRD